jgi:hypothetical protein
MPTVIRMPQVDLCEIVKNNLTLTAYFGVMTAMYPPFLEKFGQLIHPCPYTVGINFGLKNLFAFDFLLFFFFSRIPSPLAM